MSTEANKAVARRYFDEFLNQGKWTLGEGLFASNYLSHFPGLPDPLPTNERTNASIRLFTAFPDGHFDVEDMVAEGDQVVSRYTFRGTHRGVFQGIPPTGTELIFTGNETHRVVDGKIVEQWSEFDSLGMLRQLGAIPAPKR